MLNLESVGDVEHGGEGVAQGDHLLIVFFPHCAHDKIVKNVKIDQIVKIIKISPNFSC